MKAHLARKIVTVEQLKDLARGYHLGGAQLIHCHGCFDVVHPGHVRYLQSAGSHGDVLVVSLTGDDAIEKSDGTRPYIPQEYRAENLAALEFCRSRGGRRRADCRTSHRGDAAASVCQGSGIRT